MVTIEVVNEVITEWINVSINAWPIFWSWNLKTDFEWLVSGWEWPYDFKWDFWDGNFWFWRDTSNFYIEPWFFLVELIVTDKNWLQDSSITAIQVIEWLTCTNDSDGDWVNDCDDKCPLVTWVWLNDWCPILSNFCWSDCSCPGNYTCTSSDPDVCSTTGICVPKDSGINNSDACLYKNATSIIYWNANCNSCPCSNFLDFKSTLRDCDYIFPAITSPGSTEIYSKWEEYIVD